MQQRTHTIRHGVNLMPWQILPGDGLEKPCILVAVMNGNEMQSVSLHVAEQPKQDD